MNATRREFLALARSGRSARGQRALKPQANPTKRQPGRIKRPSTRSGSWCATASTIPASMASTGRSSASASALMPQPRAPGKTRQWSSTRCWRSSAPPTPIIYTTEDPAYYQLADIFVFALEHRGLERVFPKGEVSYPGIGVFTEADNQGRTFVTGVIEGAPAHAAGVLFGDEIVSADARPFPPGRLLPRQSWIARLARDPSRLGRRADRDQRIAGRSSPERDVPARP